MLHGALGNLCAGIPFLSSIRQLALPTKPIDAAGAAPDEVIQEVEHPDDPAEIDPDEATLFGEVQQAGFIERLVGTQVDVPSNSAEPVSRASSGESVLNIRFGSSPGGGPGPEEFRMTLLRGKEFERYRNDLIQAGHSCELESGALIFVPPELYGETVGALDGVELRPYNVVIAESFEYVLDELLNKIPFKRRPKVKSPRQVLQLPSQRSGNSDRMSIDTCVAPSVRMSVDASSSSGAASTRARPCSEGGDEVPPAFGAYVVSRTFVHFPSSVRDRTSVVQSSTDSAGLQATELSARGFNPRRIL